MWCITCIYLNHFLSEKHLLGFNQISKCRPIASVSVVRHLVFRVGKEPSLSSFFIFIVRPPPMTQLSLSGHFSWSLEDESLRNRMWNVTSTQDVRDSQLLSGLLRTGGLNIAHLNPAFQASVIRGRVICLFSQSIKTRGVTQRVLIYSL